MRSALLILLAAMPVSAQFTLENSNTTADLRGIDNAGGGVAWASGTNGTVLRTEDGGYLWQSCNVPPGAEKLDFRGVRAFDANSAIVMSSGPGDQSRLYKTTDGCHSWKLLFSNPDKDGFWDAIDFDRGKRGWLLGDPVNGSFAVFITEDGGQTWRKQADRGLEADSKTQGAFAASNSSLAETYGSVIFASGGNEGAFIYSLRQAEICLGSCSSQQPAAAGKKDMWERVPVPVGSRTESSGIFSIAARTRSTTTRQNRLVAVGGDYRKPADSSATSAFSVDGGDHWTASQTPPRGYRSAVAYDGTSGSWIAVGPGGTDISADDGRNWRPLHPDPALHQAPGSDSNWNALSLPYVVGPHGRIGKLDEGALQH